MESESHQDAPPVPAENRPIAPMRRPDTPESGMAFSLQPLAASCFVTQRRFEEGDRVESFLVRMPSLEVQRFDVIAERAAEFVPGGALACRWVHVFRRRAREGDADRALKLTAENLFLTLADPATEQTPETGRLLQFLALMLERKRLLRSRGQNSGGTRSILEHVRTRQRFEVPAGELTPEFFLAIQEQLTVLVGEPKPKSPPAAAQAGASGGRNAI
jgi:hypothetical protein